MISLKTAGEALMSRLQPRAARTMDHRFRAFASRISIVALFAEKSPRAFRRRGRRTRRCVPGEPAVVRARSRCRPPLERRSASARNFITDQWDVWRMAAHREPTFAHACAAGRTIKAISPIPEACWRDIRWLRGRCLRFRRLVCGMEAEGSGGNARASRVWKGESSAREASLGLLPESNHGFGLFYLTTRQGRHPEGATSRDEGSAFRICCAF